MSAEPIHLVRCEETPDEASADERFQVLFRRYYGRVKALAARRFPSCDSDDVAQETMVRVLLHSHRLDPQRDPWPYIAAIAVNVARDLARSRVPEVTLTEEAYDREVAPAADEPVLASERCANVRAVLDGLAPGSREVLTLQAYDDMSVGEIARFLGTNDNAVRQKLFRARHQFRRALASVPSGSFGLTAIVLRVRRRISAANLAQGTGLSFTSAAALAVAVAGAVTYTVSPGSAGNAAAAPAIATDVALLRTDTGSLPETPDKAVAATRAPSFATPGAPVPTAPKAPLFAAAPDAAPVRVEVAQPGSVFKDGEVHHEKIEVDTPIGPVGVENRATNYGGQSNVCTVLYRVGPC